MNSRTADLLQVAIVVFVLLFFILSALGILASRRLDAGAKRRGLRLWVIAQGVFFVIVAAAVGAAEAKSAVGALSGFAAIPFAFLIGYLSLKLTRFCHTCGAVLVKNNWLVPLRFCPGCGAKLLDGKPARDDSLLE
jgi:hypothetical protein